MKTNGSLRGDKYAATINRVAEVLIFLTGNMGD